MKGRIGNAPLVGCGGYANEYGAATSSGYGEVVMKMTSARNVVHNIESGKNAMVKFYSLLTCWFLSRLQFIPNFLLDEQKIYGVIYKISGLLLGRLFNNISLNFSRRRCSLCYSCDILIQNFDKPSIAGLSFAV